MSINDIQEAFQSSLSIGESRSFCRLFDGEDSGPIERRCWLLPGHQGNCSTHAESIGKLISGEVAVQLPETTAKVIIVGDHEVRFRDGIPVAHFYLGMAVPMQAWRPNR